MLPFLPAVRNFFDRHLYISPLLFLITILISTAFYPGRAEAQSPAQNGELVDKIVAVVNDHIILKSDVDQRVADYLRSAQQQQQQQGGQAPQFSKRLWYQVLESMIDNYVLIEKAKIDSVVVTDEEVKRSMDQRINQLIQQAGSEDALEQAFGKSLIQIKSDYREKFREDMLVQRVRQQKANEISITRPEVKEFFEEIPRDSIPTVPEQVGLSQIVRIPPPLEDAEKEARQLAEQLRDSVVTHGKDIEELARRWSEGPSASNGGLLPMMPLSDLVPEYSAAASALEPGEISQIVETTFGYHVIQLNKRVGDQISTNHILIKVDEDKRDSEKAKKFLSTLRDSVLNKGGSFSDLARKYSEDEMTASLGGKIINPQTGQRLLSLQDLDPALYRIALLLEEEGDISEPKPFSPQRQAAERAFRIVRLDKRITEHRANLEQDFEMIKQIALQRKQIQEMQQWIAELREDVYVDYKIDVPQNVSNVQLQQGRQTR